jgi:hypothetical protein
VLEFKGIAERAAKAAKAYRPRTIALKVYRSSSDSLAMLTAILRALRGQLSRRTREQLYFARAWSNQQSAKSE